MMETRLRAALLEWLRADADLQERLNGIHEEAPAAASVPFLQIAASASTDWSTKDRRGREVRVAVELHGRGDNGDEIGTTAGLVERRIASLPAAQDGFRIASIAFLKARAEARPRNMRAVLIEHRFRLIDN